MRLRRFSFLPFTMAASLAFADQPSAPEGGSPLCVWEIYVTLLTYADLCGLDQDNDRRAALQESVDLVGRFIIDNSDITGAILAETRARILAERSDYHRTSLENGVDQCDPAPEDTAGNVYRHMASHQSLDELRAWIARFVAVPRDPHQGGCL